MALPIDILDPASAVELLTTEMHRAPLQHAEWEEIAAWVGHLPLALEVLNRLLRSGEMTPRALLALSRGQRPGAAVDAAMESIRNVVPAGALRGITEAFSASYSLLTPREQYAARLIAWMAPAPLPTFVIDAFGPEVFASGVRARLRGRSFVTGVRDGSGAYFGVMHRVVADFIRAQSPAPQDEAEAVASLLLGLMESADPQGADGGVRVRECAGLVIPVFANWIAGPSIDRAFDLAMDFGTRAGIALGQWGYLALACDVYAVLASATAERLGPEHEYTLAALSYLASALSQRRDRAGAQAVLERVLEARRRLFGEAYPGGGPPDERRDRTGVQQLLEFVLDARKRILGEEHPDTLHAMSSLASALVREGDAAGAHGLLERLLEATLRILGDEHPYTIAVMDRLANSFERLDDRAGAQALRERVLELRRRLLGDEHPDTLDSMDELAGSLEKRGDRAAAQELRERVLEGRRRALGDEHPDTLWAMYCLAGTLSGRDPVRVREIREQLHRILRRLLEEEQPYAVQIRVGRLLTASTDGWEELELRKHVYRTRRERLGVQHPSTAVAAWELMNIHFAREEYRAGGYALQEARWILDHDPATLTEPQREVQLRVRAFEKQGAFAKSTDDSAP